MHCYSFVDPTVLDSANTNGLALHVHDHLGSSEPNINYLILQSLSRSKNWQCMVKLYEVPSISHYSPLRNLYHNWHFN